MIDIDYIKNNCVNEDLFKLCDSEPERVERYENIVTKKIFSYVDKEQFKNESGDYERPEDLKTVCLLLIENLFLYQVQCKNLGKKSVKIDDFSESFELQDIDLMFFGIPIDKHSLEVLNGYKSSEEYGDCGMRGVEIH